jgi:hypothetical protein
MIRFARWLPLLLAVLLVPACATPKKVAEQAIKDAEQAYAQIALQARNVAPDQAQAIEAGLAAAKASLAQGDAQAAMAAAKDLVGRIRTLSEQLPDLQAKLQDEWKDLATSVPGAIAALKKRLSDFGRPPAGMSGREQFDAATAAVPSLEQKWDAARALFDGGKLAEAVASADQVQADAVRMIAGMQTGS